MVAVGCVVSCGKQARMAKTTLAVRRMSNGNRAVLCGAPEERSGDFPVRGCSAVTYRRSGTAPRTRSEACQKRERSKLRGWLGVFGLRVQRERTQRKPRFFPNCAPTGTAQQTMSSVLIFEDLLAPSSRVARINRLRSGAALSLSSSLSLANFRI